MSYSINPTLQEFVAEYNLRNSQFFPSIDMPQLKVPDASIVKFGDRNWFRFNKWNLESSTIQYATMIDDKKMLVVDWLPPRDSFFRRNRAAKKQPEIDRMLASVRVSTDP